ncbi:MAG: 23S rRNA (guanosine(2251)-2'-O)-methyltransferase RlmB [Bacteroidia bacterium]
MEAKKSPSGFVYGIHPVVEALEAGKPIEKILLRKEGNLHERLKEILRVARERGIPVQGVPDERLERIAKGGNHQGVAAQLASVPFTELEPLLLQLQARGDVPLLVMLDGVTDVRNLGAIARAAECMGAHGLILPVSGSAAVNAEAMRASAGALNHLPVCKEHHLVDSLYMMESYGIQSMACTEHASDSLFEADLREPLCLIFGSEELGINKQLLRRTTRLVRIPLLGQISSLNVSVAAGIVLAETLRQRYT